MCLNTKSTVATSTSVVERQIGASDQARVFNVSDGGIAFNGGGAAAPYVSKWTPNGVKANSPASGGVGGGVQAVTYTEAGGFSLTGSGNVISVTDGGVIQKALDAVTGAVAQSSADNANLVDKVIAANTDQKPWWQSPLAVGGLVVGAVLVVGAFAKKP